MSETELRVVCKSCGAEVSPYVTECPYCGARVRKRAPELERRDGGLEAKQTRRERRREQKRRQKAEREPRLAALALRPWATILLILAPAVAMLVRIAIGNQLAGFGGVVAGFQSEWWRFLTAPFVYESVGYLFAVGLALALFAPSLERRLGSLPTLILLFACGSLGVLAAYGVANLRDTVSLIAGGNGIALGAIAAWTAAGLVEARKAGEELDLAGPVIAAAVILLLPVVVPTADFWAGLAGGLVGLVAGFTAGRSTASR